jgi:hypothetical protein
MYRSEWEFEQHARHMEREAMAAAERARLVVAAQAATGQRGSGFMDRLRAVWERAGGLGGRDVAAASYCSGTLPRAGRLKRTPAGDVVYPPTGSPLSARGTRAESGLGVRTIHSIPEPFTRRP